MEAQTNQDVLTILGEPVSFRPTGLSPSETAIVEFDRYYVQPDISDTDKLLLKKTMRALFSESVHETLPPCGPREKQLVLQSLLHRFRLLRSQLRGQIPPDSLLARSYTKHLLDLQSFLNMYQSTDQCVDLKETLYGQTGLDLSDDEIRALLRQFVFFILQGQNPLPEYAKTDPKPFVQKLKENPVEGFKEFVTTYQSSFPIPPRIAKVLEATDIDSAFLAAEVKRILDEERTTLLEKIRNLIPPTDPFWSKVGDTKDILRIFDIVREEHVESISEIRRLQAEIRTAQDKIRECEESKRLLEAEKTRVDRFVADAETRLKDKDGTDESLRLLRDESAEATRRFEARIAELTRQLNECVSSKTEAQAQIIALGETITSLRTEIQRLEALQRAADENLEGLQRSHQEALASERAKTAAETAKVVSATARADTASAELSSKMRELVGTKAALQAARSDLEAKETELANITRSQRDQDATLTAIRQEITEKTDEIRRLQADLLAAQTASQQYKDEKDSLQSQLSETDASFEDTKTQLQQDLQQIQQNLLRKEQESEDLRVRLAACEEEKRVLESSATGASQSVAELSGKLRIAEEQRASAQMKLSEMEVNLSQLQIQLEEEKTKSETLTAKLKDQDQTIQDQGQRIKDQQQTIKIQEADIGIYEELNKDKEYSIKSLETRLEESSKSLETRLAEEKENAEKRLSDALDDAKRSCDESLTRQKTDIEASMSKMAEEQIRETQETYEAALSQQKKSYTTLLRVVQNIAKWIDEGSTTESPSISGTEEGSDALSTIVQKLQGLKLPALGSSKSTMESHMNLCYIVFLAAFLWQTNFPPLPSAPEPNAPTFQRYQQQKLLQTILPVIFNGGSKPTKESWASSKNPSQYGFRPGVYGEIEMKRPGGKSFQKITIIRRFLTLFNKIARAMETDSADNKILGLDDLDAFFLDILNAKFNTILDDYKDIYRTGTFQLETAFPMMISDALLINQPLLKREVLDKYIIKTKDGYRITTKQEGVLNYAAIFYSFLVGIRDYLNHIEGTVYAQCPLPTILRVPKSP